MDEEDKKKKELVEAKNNADTFIYSVEKSLKEYGDKITEDEKKEIEVALEKCKKLKDTGTSAEELKAAIDELTKVSHKMAEHVYKDAQQQGAAGGTTDGGDAKTKSGEEEVVEAEFEDVD